jgi:hypothetical protein
MSQDPRNQEAQNGAAILFVISLLIMLFCYIFNIDIFN